MNSNKGVLQATAEEFALMATEMEKLDADMMALQSARNSVGNRMEAARKVLGKTVGANVQQRAWLAGSRVVTARYLSNDTSSVSVIDPERAE